jgi:hypothetical protein
VHQLLVTGSVVPSSPFLVTLMKEALTFSETSVLTRATWRNIPEDTILLSVHSFMQQGASRDFAMDLTAAVHQMLCIS